MAASTKHVKRGKWQQVQVDPKHFADHEFSNFISLETLTDYTIVKGNDGSIQIESQTEQNSTPSETSKKRKRKRKHKDKNTQEVDGKLKEKGCSKQILDKSIGTVVTKSGTFTVHSLTGEIHGKPKERNVAPKRKRAMMKNREPQHVKKRKLEAEGMDAQKSTNSEVDMSAWKDLYVPDKVLRALQVQGFTSPTSIQALALPSAIRDRMDIVGAAETGSGKTLAFGIPVLHQILLRNAGNKSPVLEHSQQEESSESGCVNVTQVQYDRLKESDSVAKQRTGKLMALILTPTRELAMQVKNHLEKAAQFTKIKIAVIVGGMAAQKQQRVLRSRPEIVVATPGRLWQLIEEGDDHLSTLVDIRCLVIDEADRMVEKGHFQELSSILELLNAEQNKSKRRQNFVFSATLTLVHQGPQRLMKKKKKFVKMNSKEKLDALMTQVGIKAKPKIIDLTRQAGTAGTLTESKIHCRSDEKDFYLYYFLLRYPGRTLVFANSIDCIRRLISIFTILEREPLALHANMHQKQRLKNLERFTSNEKGLLLATDVAARGLDIPDVQHVIHYQVPRTCENYIHRSGRTARAMKDGVSVLLVGQEDMTNYRKILHTLHREDDLPMFPVVDEVMAAVKVRVTLARKIDVEEHRANKRRHENDWFLKAAREMDVDITDDQHLLHDLGDSQKQSVHRHTVKQLRAQMKSLLKQSLASRRFMGKYPTQSGHLVVPSFSGGSADAISTLSQNGQQKRRR